MVTSLVDCASAQAYGIVAIKVDINPDRVWFTDKATERNTGTVPDHVIVTR